MLSLVLSTLLIGHNSPAQRGGDTLIIPGMGGARDEVSLKVLGGDYRLERQRVGSQTAFPDQNQKLVTVLFQLSSSASITAEPEKLSTGLKLSDADGSSYEVVRGFPLAVLQTPTQIPEAGKSLPAATRFTFGRSATAPILQATFAVPSRAMIAQISFGEGRNAPSLSIRDKVRGLDFYAETESVPLSEINASQGHWYVSRALDFKMDGHASKTGMLGEIDMAEEGERFEIVNYAVRNATTKPITLFDPETANMTFALRLSDNKIKRNEYGAILPDSEHGLAEFDLQPGETKQFRLAFKLGRGENPKEILVIESQGQKRGRTITWPWDGKGTTPWERIGGTPADEPSSEALSDDIKLKPIFVPVSQLKKKHPKLYDAAKAVGKIPVIPDHIFAPSNNLLLPMQEIVVGPTVEGGTFPTGIFEGKASGERIELKMLNTSIIRATLSGKRESQATVSTQVTQQNREGSITVAKGSAYSVTFSIPVGTKPGIYMAEFEVKNGSTRMLVPVRFIVEAEKYSLSIAPKVGTGIFMEADSSLTPKMIVYLKGNKALKVKVSVENLPKGVTVNPVEVTVQPNKPLEVPLTFSAASNAVGTLHYGHTSKIVVASTNPNLKSTFDYQVYVDPNWVLYEYSGKIGKVNYAGSMLLMGDGEWIWSTNGGTGSLVTGDILLQALCFNHPNDQGERRYFQLSLMFTAKAQTGPELTATQAQGKDQWLSDNYYAVADGGISIKFLRYDYGVFGFPPAAPWEFDGGAPAAYVKWMQDMNCRHQLKQ